MMSVFSNFYSDNIFCDTMQRRYIYLGEYILRYNARYNAETIYILAEKFVRKATVLFPRVLEFFNWGYKSG